MRYHKKTNVKFSFHQVYVFHALHNAQLSHKHENLLRDMCLSGDYLINDVSNQYVGN